MTSMMALMRVAMLVMAALNYRTATGEATRRQYVGVIADEVPVEYHPGRVLGGYPDWSGSDWSVLSGSVGGRLNQAQCVDIPANMTLCQRVGYGQMRLPNLLDHDSLHEATQQAASWVPLLNIRCHADTKMFLCSLFAPICLDRPIYPCRTLCHAVQTGCESRMSRYGFPWPEMLRCDKFPLDNDLCIGLQHHAGGDTATANVECFACSHQDTFETINHNFCVADFVVKPRGATTFVADAEFQLIASKKSVYKLHGAVIRKSDLRGRKPFYIDRHQSRCTCSPIGVSTTGDEQRGNELQQQQQHQQTPRSCDTGGRHLAMGRKDGDSLFVTYIRSLESRQRSRQLSRALRAIRHQDQTLCQPSYLRSAVAAADTTRHRDSASDLQMSTDAPAYAVKRRTE